MGLIVHSSPNTITWLTQWEYEKVPTSSGFMGIMVKSEKHTTMQAFLAQHQYLKPSDAFDALKNADLVGFHGNDGAERKDERMDVLHVEVVRSDRVRH